MRCGWITARYAVLGLLAASCGMVDAQEVILRDDFDGTGIVDTTVWRLPFDSEGTFVGRTQFRGDSAIDMPLQGVVEASASDGKVTELHFDTYSVIDPGNAFLGTDLLTKRNFARGGGISFESRLRLAPGAAAGLVGGSFLFDVTRQIPAGSGNEVRDEIDWELISNQTVGAATQDIFTNYWDDGDFSNNGDGQFDDVAGLDLTQFQDYRMEWTPQSIKWYVNTQLIRTETVNVPDDPMKVHFNIWAPDSGFSEAFNAALQPVATEGANSRYTVQVDHVEVSRINTTVSDNLLTDGSFEDVDTLAALNGTNGGLQNEWLRFGNVFIEADDLPGTNPSVPDQAPDGIFMAKMFGPFSGGSDASGLIQNVAASPGEEFEASVMAHTTMGDSIAGNANFNTIALSFIDASGNVIESNVGGSDFVPTNGNDFPLLDGRDPNLTEDLWVEGVVSAVAPAGTVSARVSLFFIQINNEGGSSWFDDVSLVRLTPDTPLLPGDYNNDGVVDSADYTVWRDSEGATGLTPWSPGDGNGDGNITQADYDVWRSQFGMTLGGSLIGDSTTAIPEPTAVVLMGLGVLVGVGIARRRAR